MVFSQTATLTDRGCFSQLFTQDDLIPESLQVRRSDSCTDSSVLICAINMIEFRYVITDEYADDLLVQSCKPGQLS